MSVLLRTIRRTVAAVGEFRVPRLIALFGMIVAFSIVLVPAEAASPLKVIAIAPGSEHTCALMSSGGVKCWGFNGNNQLGVSTGKRSHVVKPLGVRGLSSGVKAIVAGNQHSCAITSRGGVKCWGNNNRGTIGNGGGKGTESSTGGFGWRTPVDVRGLTSGVTALSSSYDHTCAVTNAGEVKCWGNTFRGDGSTTLANPVPFTVPGLTGVKAIASSASFSCALTGTDGAKCWGAGFTNGVGSLVPVDIPGLTSGVKAIAAGLFHACALTVGGGVNCWGGDNLYGELGTGAVRGRVWPPSNVVGLTSGVTAITAGSSFTCALTTQGGVKCWGSNGWGQLGNNSAPRNLPAKYSPVDVYGLKSGVKAIAAGSTTACAVMRNGGAKCWGSNGWGQLGNSRVKTGDISAKPVDVQFGPATASANDAAPKVATRRALPSVGVAGAMFITPSGNLFCKMGSSAVYCQSVRRPHSVRMSLDGRLAICGGSHCLGNPAGRPRALSYGRQITVGGFRCLSQAAGITCTVIRSGKGFLIDRAGVSRVGQ